MADLSTQSVLLIGGIHDLLAGVADAFHTTGAHLTIAYQPPLPDANTRSNYPAARWQEVTLHDPEVLADELAELSFQTVVISPGWFTHAPFMQASPEDIDAALAFNLEYATYAAQAAAKRLIAQGKGGVILFLSSVVGLMPMIHTNLVGSSLAAVEVIAQMAAVDLAPHGIRVNVVAAGWMEGDWSEPVLTANGTMTTPTDIPAGKAGSPQQVGEACCFLASPGAQYITGAVLPVDGGFLLTKLACETPYPAPSLQ